MRNVSPMAERQRHSESAQHRREMLGGARVAVPPVDHSASTASRDPVVSAFLAQHGFAGGPFAEHARIQVLLRAVAFAENAEPDQPEIDEVPASARRGHRELRFDFDTEPIEVQAADALERRIGASICEFDDATQPTHATRAGSIARMRAQVLPPGAAGGCIDRPFRAGLRTEVRIGVRDEKLFALGGRKVDQGAIGPGAPHPVDFDDVALVERQLVPDEGAAAGVRGRRDHVDRIVAESPERQTEQYRRGHMREHRWAVTVRLPVSNEYRREMTVLRVPPLPGARFDASVSADALPRAGAKLRSNCSPLHPVALVVGVLERRGDAGHVVGMVHGGSQYRSPNVRVAAERNSGRVMAIRGGDRL
ncbi:hypothetical protein [Leucobacter chromiiresistens]|uniref:hypothetical protein n=1 Tax=Leucobacter chromiiresistens TaxID=1079994 RepID=UPI0012DE0965|nr:hypothetical protein [Leucobacter chromiiresistens]